MGTLIVLSVVGPAWNVYSINPRGELDILIGTCMLPILFGMTVAAASSYLFSRSPKSAFVLVLAVVVTMLYFCDLYEYALVAVVIAVTIKGICYCILCSAYTHPH